MSPFVPGSIAAVAVAGAFGVALSMHQSTAQQGHPYYRAIVQVPTPPFLACPLTATVAAGSSTASARPTPACKSLQFGSTTAP